MTYKILVAEDDTDIQEVLRLYLVNSGFEVVSAYDGSEAYELMLSEKPDLALLDIMMPVINGYELTKKIREISNIPIIILSAMNADSDKILGLDIGADDYITKPFNPLEVIARIQSNLRRKYKLDSSAAEENGDMLTVGELKLDTKKFILYKKRRGDNADPHRVQDTVPLYGKAGHGIHKGADISAHQRRFL